jgi:hypothetical protein
MATSNEDEACITMLVSAQRDLEKIVAGSHFKFYQLNSRLLSSYLLLGDYSKALESCELVLSYLMIAFAAFGYHPLITLQLFTTGTLTVVVMV